MRTLTLVGSNRQGLAPFADLPASQMLSAVGGNCGNVLFEDAVLSLFEDQEIVNWGEFVAASPRRWSGFDQIVIPCANQVGPHTDMGRFGEALRKADRPVIAIGLGAQGSDVAQTVVEVGKGTLSWLQALHDLRPVSDQPNISTRGRWSQRVLAQLGVPSTSAACPSVLLDGRFVEASGRPRAVVPETEGLSVAIAAGHTDWPRMKETERQLIAILNASTGRTSYIAQSDTALLSGYREKESVEKFRSYGMPMNTYADAFAFLRRNLTHFRDTPSWVMHLAAFDLVLGARFHGVMAGSLAGRPSLALAADARVWELALSSGLPAIAPQQLHDCDLGALTKALTIWSERGARRRSAAKAELMDFLASNLQIDQEGERASGPTTDAAAAAESEFQACNLEREPGLTGSGPCKLRGRIESASNGRVSGWAVCDEHPNAQVLAVLHDSKGAMATIRCGTYREDLVVAGVSSGFSGFNMVSVACQGVRSLTLRDCYGTEAHL